MEIPDYMVIDLGGGPVTMATLDTMMRVLHGSGRVAIINSNRSQMDLHAIELMIIAAHEKRKEKV